MRSNSVLIIGATGALGRQLLYHFAEERNIHHVHAFCRNPGKLSDIDERLCESIIAGDARKSQDVERALALSKPDYVVLCTGNGMDLRKSDTREKTGQALAQAMDKPAFHNVKAVVISSHGAADTKIKVGMGIGMVITNHLRHVLADHTPQEKAFSSLMKRTLIVRPTALTNEKGGSKLVEFDGNKKGPSIHADRSDVAAWIAQKVSKNPANFVGRKLSLTSAK